MYRHLLVPVDGTDLSIETVGRAVEFARSLGARITFLHVEPDPMASLYGGPESTHPCPAPDEFAYPYAALAQELLTKAESAARAQGVPCAASSIISDAPCIAVLAAAREAGCDLIFTASPGVRSNGSMPVDAQLLQLLASAEIPVLVAANTNLPTVSRVIAVIRSEHRSLTAVIHAWLYLLKTAQWRGVQADIALMQAMARYLKVFPAVRHHPKEDKCLFRRLRDCASEIAPELAELEHQHQRDGQLIAELTGMIENYASGGISLSDIEQAVSHYAQFIWDHIGREEGVILPAARRYLTDKDWSEIDAAFNDCPNFDRDEDADFNLLWARIASTVCTTAQQSQSLIESGISNHVGTPGGRCYPH